MTNIELILKKIDHLNTAIEAVEVLVTNFSETSLLKNFFELKETKFQAAKELSEIALNLEVNF